MAPTDGSPSGARAAVAAVRRAVSRAATALSPSEADGPAAERETLSPDEAIRRAHALGVAAAFGRDADEALAEVREALDGSYDRSVVDLAYREGRADAEGVDRASAAPTGSLDPTTDDPGRADPTREVAPDRRSPDRTPTPERDRRPTPAGTAPTATALPTAVDRGDLLDGGADLETLSFPGLLGASPSGDGEGTGDPDGRPPGPDGSPLGSDGRATGSDGRGTEPGGGSETTDRPGA